VALGRLRERACGQAEALIPGEGFDLRPRQSAGDDPSDDQRADDRDGATVVVRGPEMNGSTVGALGLLSQVAVAPLGEEGTQQGMTPPQQRSHQVPFHAIKPLALWGGLMDAVEEVVALPVGLEGGPFRCPDYRKASLMPVEAVRANRDSASRGPFLAPPLAPTP
jgi:hypothetical protein